MDLPISSMMQNQTISVAMDHSIAMVEKVLRNNNLSAVPVVDAANGAVIGIISARDLLRFHQEKKDPAAVHAWEVCTYKPIEVTPDTSVTQVARLMVEHGVHHVLVTRNTEVVGIVSALDFVRQFIQASHL